MIMSNLSSVFASLAVTLPLLAGCAAPESQAPVSDNTSTKLWRQTCGLINLASDENDNSPQFFTALNHACNTLARNNARPGDENYSMMGVLGYNYVKKMQWHFQFVAQNPGMFQNPLLPDSGYSPIRVFMYLDSVNLFDCAEVINRMDQTSADAPGGISPHFFSRGLSFCKPVTG